MPFYIVLIVTYDQKLAKKRWHPAHILDYFCQVYYNWAMRLTIRSEYAVRAMICLAKTEGGGPVRTREIAQKEGISRFLIDQIFMKLRKGGLVKSTRGRAGGYALAKAPDRISIGDIIKSVEGPIYILKCCSSDGACKKSSVCKPHSMWQKINSDIEKVLDRAKIGALL